MKILKKNKKNTGITLIALVITIIVLLILVGISISMISGNNSILNQASIASTNTIHVNVLEKLKIDVTGNYIDKLTGNTSNGIIEYLTSKEIIGEEIKGENNEGTRKWQINVEKLLGSKQSVGNGSKYKDVYMLEEKEEDGKKNYEVNYYEKDESTKLNVGMLNGLNTNLAEEPFTLRYESGYLWVGLKEGAVRDANTLTDTEKQMILDNYVLYIKEELKKSGYTEEEVNEQTATIQSGISAANEEQKKQVISMLINNALEIEPKGSDEYRWSSKYNRMLIGEKGEYTATYYDFLANPVKKTKKTIKIDNLDEYIIDLGMNSRDYSFWVSTKHFENNEYKDVHADRVKILLDGVEMFNGVPPERDYNWYFYEINENIEENKEYMADITAYFGDKEVKFKGKITVGFPS